MTNPITVVISDTHYHNFDQFSTTNEQGVNSRLQHIIDATKYAFDSALKQGATRVIHGGDCFHVRGKIIPTVLNPVMKLYQEYAGKFADGIYMIAGNHDLEGRDSDWVSNASSALAGCGVTVITKPTMLGNVALLPWFNNLDDLRAELAKLKNVQDVYMHAALNGVISGIPDHGLSYEELGQYDAKRFFLGHFHNYKMFILPDDRKVISIGALTHQNFGDVGSRAGFIVLDDKQILQQETRAPKFVSIDMNDIESECDWADASIRMQGAFVRLKCDRLSNEEANTLRAEVMNAGAEGLTIVAAPKESFVTREGVNTVQERGSVTLESSIEAYIDNAQFDLADEIKAEALSVLADSQE